jgi:hypothetical protein
MNVDSTDQVPLRDNSRGNYLTQIAKATEACSARRKWPYVTTDVSCQLFAAGRNFGVAVNLVCVLIYLLIWRKGGVGWVGLLVAGLRWRSGILFCGTIAIAFHDRHLVYCIKQRCE